jgi:hypothetical protein
VSLFGRQDNVGVAPANPGTPFALCPAFVTLRRILSTLLAGAPERASRLGTGVLSVFDHLNTIDQNVFYARRVLMRFFEGGVICDCRRVKDDHVREHSLAEKSPVIKAKVRRRHSA